MIPKDAIIERGLTHRWQRDDQIEQDLLLEAVLHRAAQADSFDSMAFIGGTCLHKLYVQDRNATPKTLISLG